jgi:hypothetical protein
MASKIACIGLAFVGAVSGFSFNGASTLARVPARSSISSLSMSGIGNTKSVTPDDSRRGGEHTFQMRDHCDCFKF